MSKRATRWPLQIEAPTARCGNCGFTNSLNGTWEVTNGRLDWCGSADPLTGRGPSLDWCGECGAELALILVEQSPASGEWHDEPLSDVDRESLLREAEAYQNAQL